MNFNGPIFWIALVQIIGVNTVLSGDNAVVIALAARGLAAAIKTILLADLVMSLDNVIAVAAAAKGNTPLLVIGLAISIPLVVFASRLLLVLMERFPVIITVGAALLGWVAGDMAVTDPIDKPWVDLHAAFLHWGAPLACAIAVVVAGKWLAARKSAGIAARAAARAAAAPAAAAGAHLQRVLLAVDNSEGAMRAVRHLLGLRNDLRDSAALAVHLLNVQRPLPGDVTQFVPGRTVEDYHHERGNAGLAPARAALDTAGLAHQDHQRVGDPGPTIAEVARELGCDMIVMGARGLGGSAAALLGSVAQSTIEHAGVPVLVVK